MRWQERKLLRLALVAIESSNNTEHLQMRTYCYICTVPASSGSHTATIPNGQSHMFSFNLEPALAKKLAVCRGIKKKHLASNRTCLHCNELDDLKHTHEHLFKYFDNFASPMMTITSMMIMILIKQMMTMMVLWLLARLTFWTAVMLNLLGQMSA